MNGWSILFLNLHVATIQLTERFKMKDRSYKGYAVHSLWAREAVKRLLKCRNIARLHSYRWCGKYWRTCIPPKSSERETTVSSNWMQMSVFIETIYCTIKIEVFRYTSTYLFSIMIYHTFNLAFSLEQSPNLLIYFGNEVKYDFISDKKDYKINHDVFFSFLFLFLDFMIISYLHYKNYVPLPKKKQQQILYNYLPLMRPTWWNTDPKPGPRYNLTKDI